MKAGATTAGGTRGQSPQGQLAIVATPIGCLDDISARALEVLRSVERILCEDTRHTAKLLQHYNITTPTTSLHEHNEASRTEQFISRLAEGAHLALVSDAGTPLVSDPGAHFVAAAHRAGVRVVCIPGACALTAALSAAGFDASQFVFGGFVPARATTRQKYFSNLASEQRTLVFYEAPHRIEASVADLMQVFGDERQACLVKEISKSHERAVRGSLKTIQEWLCADNEDKARCRGEFVIVVEGSDAQEVKTTVDADALMEALKDCLSPGQAATILAKLTGGKRNQIYRRFVEDKDTK